MEEDEEKYANYKQMTINAINNFLALQSSQKNITGDFEINQEALRKAIVEKNGVPTLISQQRSQTELHTWQNE